MNRSALLKVIQILFVGAFLLAPVYSTNARTVGWTDGSSCDFYEMPLCVQKNNCKDENNDPIENPHKNRAGKLAQVCHDGGGGDFLRWCKELGLQSVLYKGIYYCGNSSRAGERCKKDDGTYYYCL